MQILPTNPLQHQAADYRENQKKVAVLLFL
jgi:hypothetical protein